MLIKRIKNNTFRTVKCSTGIFMFKTIYIEIKMYIVFFVLIFIKTLNYLVNNSYNNGVTVILWNYVKEV
jgi:hypothetical protein